MAPKRSFTSSSILASIPGSANVSQATLKLYVHTVTTAGSFNVDYVKRQLGGEHHHQQPLPVLGTTIAPSMPITAASKNQYILIDVTSALQAWLSGSQANDGIARWWRMAPSAPALTVKRAHDQAIRQSGLFVFRRWRRWNHRNHHGQLAAVDRWRHERHAQSIANQHLCNQSGAGMEGTAWACANPRAPAPSPGRDGGHDMTGGGTSGTGHLNLDTTKVPQLAAANVFTNNQTIAGTSSNFGLTVSGATYEGILLSGPEAFIGSRPGTRNHRNQRHVLADSEYRGYLGAGESTS